MKPTSVVLRQVEDADGTRHLAASITADGALRIEGQDLGEGVRRVFGVSEYEWAWTIPAKHLPALQHALASDDDVLAALAARFSGDNAASLDAFLKANNIPTERWSRLGD